MIKAAACAGMTLLNRLDFDLRNEISFQFLEEMSRNFDQNLRDFSYLHRLHCFFAHLFAVRDPKIEIKYSNN